MHDFSLFYHFHEFHCGKHAVPSGPKPSFMHLYSPKCISMPRFLYCFKGSSVTRPKMKSLHKNSLFRAPKRRNRVHTYIYIYIYIYIYTRFRRFGGSKVLFLCRDVTFGGDPPEMLRNGSSKSF